MSNTLKSRGDLLKALASEGLPATQVTLDKYERGGIIKKPKLVLNNVRWYNASEFERTVEAVRQHAKENGLVKKK